jgi:hypothetical protein
MAAQFTALDYDMAEMTDYEINGAIRICSSNKMLGARNLNALYEESYARADMPNPLWNTAGRYA